MLAEKVIVMRDSPEAAELKTVTGWVSRLGRFFGQDESTARYDGCTHQKCAGCDAVIERSSWCRSCREKKDLEKWLAAEREEWDGTTPLYSDSRDKYFFNDDAEEYAEDEGVELDDLRLYICVPQYGRHIETDYFCDELAEDGEVPGVILEAMEKLNEAIKAAGPLSWYPGKKVPTFGAAKTG